MCAKWGTVSLRQDKAVGQQKTTGLEPERMTLMGLIPSSTINSRLILRKFCNLSFFTCRMGIVFLSQVYFEDFNQ